MFLQLCVLPLVCVLPFALGAQLVTSPFYEAFSNSATEFTEIQTARMLQANQTLQSLESLSEEQARNGTVVLGLYESIMRDLDLVGSQASLLSSVHPDKSYRTAADEISSSLSAMTTALGMNKRVFNTLKMIDPAMDPKLDEVALKYLSDVLRDFRLSGVDKDEDTRSKVRAVSAELNKIGESFDHNIIEGKRQITVSLKNNDLDGLPDDFIALMKEKSVDGNLVNISTDYPESLPVMKLATKADVRKRMSIAFDNRAYPENEPVLQKMIDKRYELATLLGFDNYADFATTDKMIGSSARVKEFTDRIIDAARARAQAEYNVVLARKKKEFPAETAVNSWEHAYWEGVVRREQYAFDASSLRPYLAYDTVQAGVFDVAGSLFNVSFRDCAKDIPVWHEAVSCHELIDPVDGLIGRFYLDMHPREDKYKHAAQFGIRSGVRGVQIAEASLVCNFPSDLMEFSQVVTFFHEFGHLLHHIFSGQESRFVGLSIEWDFIEAPSQFLEEWPHDGRVLRRFAKHHKTGEPIPDKLLAQMKRAESFGRGLGVMRQMMYAKISLTYYNRPSSQVGIWSLFQRNWELTQLYPFVPNEHHTPVNFGHLNGYSAIYYTYMWSLVIAKDLFSQFNTDNLMEANIAHKYKRAILSKGGTKPAAELIKDFLGRNYSFESYSKWLNSDPIQTPHSSASDRTDQPPTKDSGGNGLVAFLVIGAVLGVLGAAFFVRKKKLLCFRSRAHASEVNLNLGKFESL